ncbi:hypothetical protein E2C01_049575 [Portunus trituberculatus]|uniref:Uncharacterized protein n=1 Tax=Portunus trituberculatus TaxID=210409 RepID=A0A5B7G9U4_PORTR|nr:hypothetical protein [Portunus trituberculatus]
MEVEVEEEEEVAGRVTDGRTRSQMERMPWESRPSLSPWLGAVTLRPASRPTPLPAQHPTTNTRITPLGPLAAEAMARIKLGALRWRSSPG